MTELRRSSRANRGQNTRLEEQIRYEELMAKTKRSKAAASGGGNKAGGKKRQNNEEDDSVQCLVCGTTDSNFDEDSDSKEMIQCDDCQTWQHTECILGQNNVPNDYKCNVCDPNNELYKTLSFKIDPKPLVQKHKNLAHKRKVNHSDDDDDDDDDPEDYVNEVQGHDDEDDQDFSADESEFKQRRKPSIIRKRSRTQSIDEKSITPPKRRSSKINNDDDEKHRQLELKTKEAVQKRFETMFNTLLLHDSKIPGEDEPADVISKKWAIKLEEDLFAAYHDPDTGKRNREYKEVSTRIYVNVKDVKNIKLRNSIINKTIPFDKLVKMPVTELLNPDLRKEKEEAIKESMELATLEAPKESNIRRTHKGDILLEKEDNSSSSQKFDYNVGMSLDNDEKKFTESENTVNVERKSSLYQNGNNHDESEDENYNDHDPENNVQRERSNSIHEDDALLQILGETEKDQEVQQNEYIPNQLIWSGQTVFVGVTNFASQAQLTKKTLKNDDFDKISTQLIDCDLPLEIEGRLDLRKADDYIKKVSESRKLILLELISTEQDSKSFLKLFDYFYTRAKCGVVKNKQPFIKDAYLIATKGSQHQHHLPRFFQSLGYSQNDDSSRLFIVFVIKQEAIKNIPVTSNAPSIATSVPSFEFLSRLNPYETELVNKIFDERPETRVDSNLLINYLREKLQQQQQTHD